jgi:ABC-type sugar transport system permease subunit
MHKSHGFPGSAVTRRPTLGNLKRTEALWDAATITPPLVLVIVFLICPIGICFYLSLTNWNGFDPNMDFIGLKNYVKLFHDKSVIRAIIFTAMLAVFATTSINAASLGTAMLLNRRSTINNILRALVLSPYVIGAVVIGFLGTTLFGTYGAINSLLESVGLERIPFLAQPAWAQATVIMAIIWFSFGFHTVLYLAGLQAIDSSMLEAAAIDGAGPWQAFWRVKLPLLAPNVTLNIMLSLIGQLKTYELVLSLTDGGPAGFTETIVYSIITGSLEHSKLGYGAAQSIVLMVVIIAASLIVNQLRSSSDEAVKA